MLVIVIPPIYVLASMILEAAKRVHPGLEYPLLLSPLVLAFVFHVLRSKPRKRFGYCRKCGYDLRATPDRCPECGTKTWER